MKPTADNLYKLQNGLTTKFEGEIKQILSSEKTTIKSKSTSREGCSLFTIIVKDCHGCVGKCDECLICWTYTSFFLYDSGGGDSGGGGGDFSSGVGPNQGAGGSSYSFPDANAPDTTFFEPNTNNLQGELDEIYATKFNEFINSLQSTNINSFNYLNQNQTVKNQIFNYLSNNDFSSDSIEFAIWAITYLDNHPNLDFEFILNNKTEYNTSSNDIDNNTEGNYDETVYSDFNPLQDTWSNITSVIPVNKFVGWGYPNVKQNCMDYAKAQIKKMGFQISNYSAIGQTFQIYTTQNGVNQTKLNQGLSYIKYALSNGIPVIVGIDDAPGSPNAATDNSTDHFVVIVGMGTNSNGNYFQFYDNASGNSIQGANPLNLLYFNPTTNQISGSSQCSGYVNCCTTHNYILTQIRKSKN